MNRLLLFFLLLTTFSCAQWVREPASISTEKHVVFDIDWTITSEVKPEFQGARFIEVEGKKYFVHEGLEEMIEDLVNQKKIKISFFSGGSFSRNHKLLKQIRLKDGRSLEDIAYKILNQEDLTIVEGALSTDKFSKRFKKDLTKISSDLDNLVMYDDTEHFVLNEKQEEHVLWIGKTFEHFENFKDAKLASGDYVPRTMGEWSFARKKLSIIHGATISALNASTDTGLNFSEAMRNEAVQLNLASGEWNDYSLKMLKISNRLTSSSSFGTSACFELVAPFLLE